MSTFSAFEHQLSGIERRFICRENFHLEALCYAYSVDATIVLWVCYALYYCTRGATFDRHHAHGVPVFRVAWYCTVHTVQ